METSVYISGVQKLAVYETKSRMYIIGTSSITNKFRILKIDRLEQTDLTIMDDRIEYSYGEVQELLDMIDKGNQPRNQRYEKHAGLRHVASAFGIVGFIRFLEGYYIILITRRRRVACIGGHSIYKIDDSALIPITSEAAQNRINNPHEARYLKIFQNVDLSSNFYYSYSYDLTHSLQYNIPPVVIQSPPGPNCDIKSPEVRVNAGSHLDDPLTLPRDIKSTLDDTDMPGGSLTSLSDQAMEEQVVPKPDNHLDVLDILDNSQKELDCPQVLPRRHDTGARRRVLRIRPCSKFVWNENLLGDFERRVHPDWVIHLIHGFVGQNCISIYGKPIFITLIARRSSKYAGTRFLKRGCNDEGFVANEVETEQIVHNGTLTSLQSGQYTSYVQLRGSVPYHWSQDTSQNRIVPKPQIVLDRADPYFMSAGLHCNQLLERYGAPVVILNLVKKRERKPHEQILSEQLSAMVEYLNQFLPPKYHIQYIAWDMARVTKSKQVNVMERLAEIATKVVKLTGIFHSGTKLYCNQLREHPAFSGFGGLGSNDQSPSLKQTGVVRMNCVDCLDRTNTAQFMVGMAALGYQFCMLGLIDKPVVEFDSFVCRALEELYEAHGDTLALQYGGSQMVHRIQTYRKIAPWTSHSRDITQTVSRYFSNAFQDSDKQMAINLFLGVFVPSDHNTHLWDLTTDYYLHNTRTHDFQSLVVRPSYTAWYNPSAVRSLPLSFEEVMKEEAAPYFLEEVDEDLTDLHADYYHTTELTAFDLLLSHMAPNSARDGLSSNKEDLSPFTVQANVKARYVGVPVRNTVGGSPTDIDENESGSDSSDLTEDERTSAPTPRPAIVSSNNSPQKDKVQVLPEQRYGLGITDPSPDDVSLYHKYSQVWTQSLSSARGWTSRMGFIKLDSTVSNQNGESSRSPRKPTVPTDSLAIYRNFIQVSSVGPNEPDQESVDLYREYIRALA